MILLFLKAEQFGLFDSVVNVKASVRKDGTVVAPHTKRVKVRAKLTGHKPIIRDLFAPQEPEQAGLDFEAPAAATKAPEPNPHGYVTPPKLDKPTIEHDGDTWYIQNTGTAREDGTVMAHLSSATRGRQTKNGVNPLQINDWIPREKLGLGTPEGNPWGEKVTHTTGKGKVIEGYIRRDLTSGEAAEIDKYTFRKDGGYFIRAKHVDGEAKPIKAAVKPAEAPARVYLAVSFNSKDFAKKHGAKWDADHQLWYTETTDGEVSPSLQQFVPAPSAHGAAGARFAVKAAALNQTAKTGVKHEVHTAELAGTDKRIHYVANAETGEAADKMVDDQLGAKFGPADVAAEEGPKEGDRNAEGLVFRDGRWHREEENRVDAAAKRTRAELRVEPSATAGEYQVRGDGNTIMATFEIGRNGKPVRVRKFHDHHGQVMPVIEAFIADRKAASDALWSDDAPASAAPVAAPAAPAPAAPDLSDPISQAVRASLAGKFDLEIEDWNKLHHGDDLKGVAYEQWRTKVNPVADANLTTAPAGRIKTRLAKLHRELARMPKWGSSLKDSTTARVQRLEAELGRRGEFLPKPEQPVRAAVGKGELPGLDYSKAFGEIRVPEFGVAAGIGKAERRDLNRQAAALAANMPEKLTPDQRKLLTQYSGNGGCGDSLNEFYTPPEVAAAIWKALEQMGVKGGTALEPSAATGVFLETAPAGFRVTGVELDGTSATIGKALHPRHEYVNASLERFVNNDGDRQFDAVIGNPPFGPRGGFARDDKIEIARAETYFTDTALDKLKPGGVAALVVHSGLMTSRNERANRARLLRKGEFLGAIRMPNSAFEHSHTDVTTDVVFFRKRDNDVAQALMAIKDDKLVLGLLDDREFVAGQYFKGRGADNVRGTEGTAMRSFGEIYTVEGTMAGVPEAIAAFKPEETKQLSMGDIESWIQRAQPDLLARVRAAAQTKPYGDAREGDTKEVDGRTYVLTGNPLRWHLVDEFMATDEVAAALDLADEIGRSMEGETPEGLADRVRAYIEKFGNPNKSKALRMATVADRRIYRLMGAVDKDGKLSDAVTGERREIKGSIDSVATALALGNKGRVFNADELAARMGRPVDEVEDYLHASDAYAIMPNGAWSPMAEYLTGDLWGKYDAAKAAADNADLPEQERKKLARQRDLLLEAIDPQSLDDVDIALNSAFIPTAAIAAWLDSQRDAMAANSDWARGLPDAKVTFEKGTYKVSAGIGRAELLSKYLNRDGVKKDDMDTIRDMNEEFKAWLCGSRFRDEVEEQYNRSFRGFVAERFSNEPFEIPGMVTAGLKDFQYGGVRWALQAGKGIVAADVGLGKTVRGLMIARMAKLEGRCKKPTIVVPKSVLANWKAEQEKWFPDMRVAVIGETYTRGPGGELKSKADTAAERDRKYADIAQNDYDLVLISQPAWNDLDIDPIKKGEYIGDDFWVQRGDAKGNVGDKKLNDIRTRYEQAVAGRDFRERSGALYFNETGIDMLLLDEAHGYKNLYKARNRFGETPKFLGGQGESKRALDTNLKTRWIREQNNGNNVFLLTATPTKNSPLEIYSMLSHVAPEAFIRIGIRNSEEFLDRFCQFETGHYPDPQTGEIKEGEIVSGFKNLDELRRIMGRYIDRKTAADVGLVLPERDDRLHTVDMTPVQAHLYQELRELAEQAANSGDATGDAHIFSIMDKMNKVAIHPGLHEKSMGSLDAKDSPKIQKCVAEILKGREDGGQVVFCDSVPMHQAILKALVAAGVPEAEIGVINAKEAEDSAKRQNIADKFNAGKLTVVIGNTATMGEGINLQKATTDIHHLDLPWEPASVQQRNGRGLRQGNLKESVRIHSYLAKGSFDAYRHRTLSAKRDWQDALWNGSDIVNNPAKEFDLSRDEMMIMLAPDPDQAREALESNKRAANARFEAAKRSEAAGKYDRLVKLRRSLRDLPNKDSAAGERLRYNIKTATDRLRDDPYFLAKELLDTDKPALVHPQSGAAIVPGMGIETLEGGKVAAGKWLVASVDPVKRTVRLRPMGAAKLSEFKLSDLARTSDTFPVKSGDEAAEIARKFGEDAAFLKSPADLRGMPSAEIEKNRDAIVASLRHHIHKGTYQSLGYSTAGDIPAVDDKGDLRMVGLYSAKAEAETINPMLPTDDHREVMLRALREIEGNKAFGDRTVKSGRSHKTITDLHYTGYKADAVREVATKLFGEGIHAEARAAHVNDVLQRMKDAPDFAHAAKLAVTALHKPDHYGTKMTMPRAVIEALHEKAKAGGHLGRSTKLSVQLPGSSYYSRNYGIHHNLLHHDHELWFALGEMAKRFGYADLEDKIKSEAAR